MFRITGAPSRREKIVIRTLAVLACCGGVVAWALHDSTEWVHVINASAPDVTATVVAVGLDACVPNAPITVSETDDEIRVSVQQRWNPGGESKLCLSGASVQLKSPIGSRHIIDGHGGTQVPIVFSADHPPPAPPNPISGKVADVQGHEALATVTAWLILHRDFSLLCDELSDKGDSCASDPIEVDFTKAPQELPTDLIVRGDVRVSRSPITLTGSLKGDILFVGVTP